MVVGNRGGKEQIVAALLYIFPVGVGSREKKEERRRKKKEKEGGKREDSFVSIVSSRAFNACALLSLSLPDV